MHRDTGLLHWDIVERDAFGRLSGLTRTRGRRPAAAYRLLVPVDGSPTGLEAARVAARLSDSATDAELHLLNIQPILGVGYDNDTAIRLGQEQADAALAAIDGNQATPCVIRISAGAPAEAILAYAEAEHIDEIVLGSVGAGSMSSALLGSVAMDVLRESRRPITLVKPGARSARFPPEWVDWLVPCDGSAPARNALAHVLRRIAASGRRSCVHLLNVRPAANPAIRPDRAALRALRAEAAAEFPELLAALREAGVDHEFHVAIGDPVARILEFAEDLGCGHIAMGSRGLGWLGGLLLGSISSGVLRRTPVPLTLLK